MEIPEEFAPHPAQIPSWITPETMLRFELCFAIGRAICGRDDAAFVRELFEGDIPTQALEASADPALQ